MSSSQRWVPCPITTNVQVDCTENQELCAEFGVNGYPTLKVFRNGVPVDYSGPRKADGIISYMLK
jgi:protein disulfide-isomerase A1